MTEFEAQCDAISEFYKLKDRLNLTQEEMVIMKKYKGDCMENNKDEMFKAVAKWAFKYKGSRFKDVLQFAPKNVKSSSLRVYLSVAKTYLETGYFKGNHLYKKYLDIYSKPETPEIKHTEQYYGVFLENTIRVFETLGLAKSFLEGLNFAGNDQGRIVCIEIKDLES